MGIFKDVDPESQREAAWIQMGTTHHSYYSRYSYRMWKNLASSGFIHVREAFHVKKHLREVQLSALHGNNRGGDKPFL